jgi:hypothetical protein
MASVGAGGGRRWRRGRAGAQRRGRLGLGEGGWAEELHGAWGKLALGSVGAEGGRRV